MLCLKAVRQEKGLSRYQLSKITGLRDSKLQNIENSNEPNQTFKVMCKITDALEITLNELRSDLNASNPNR